MSNLLGAHNRRLVIDQLALRMRRPSAAPTLTIRETIGIALAGTPWAEDRGEGVRVVDPDSPIIDAILKCLDDAGYEIKPK